MLVLMKTYYRVGFLSQEKADSRYPGEFSKNMESKLIVWFPKEWLGTLEIEGELRTMRITASSGTQSCEPSMLGFLKPPKTAVLGSD